WNFPAFARPSLQHPCAHGGLDLSSLSTVRAIRCTSVRRLQKARPSTYIGPVGKPTMAINAAWHKRFGPGGGTRRLHHSLPLSPGRGRWGRNRIDERGKGAVFARYGSAVTGHTQVPTITTLHSLLPPKQRT